MAEDNKTDDSTLKSEPIEVDDQNAPPIISFEFLAGKPMKADSATVIELKREGREYVPSERMKSCKVLKFLPGWTFKDALNEISQLNANLYENLFVFIINLESLEIDMKELGEAFKKFLFGRQVIIQLRLKEDEKTRTFYNKLNEKLFEEVTIGVDESDGFSSFLQKSSNFKDEEAIFNLLQNPDVLTLRFLTVFDFAPEFSFRIVSHCAANFSKAHFLAALGVPFKDDEGSLNKGQSRMISSVFKDQKYRSVLEAALNNENSEVFEYLNREYWFLIQRLPSNHQKVIANKLVRENKLDELCDLLEISELPFPTETDPDTIKHERFEQIVSQRKHFHASILSENFEEIDEFIDLRSDLKIVYSTDNKSAMFVALSNNKDNVFLHLKERGLKGKDFQKLQQKLMLQNIHNSLTDSKKSAQILAARSKIHHREDLKNDECEQRKKIKSWFEAIKETELGGPLINAAAQCDDLQIVFDFGRTDVAGVDLDSPNADGIMYRKEKVIIIGAKYTRNEQVQDDKRVEAEKDPEQEIKGTLAHELAHYVIGMVFGNDEQPYFNKSDARYLKYKQIVDKYKYFKEDEDFDDECEGIVSFVYRLYGDSDFDAELIVRIFQIQARYDHDQVKVKQLTEKYSDLFGFGLEDVLPEMKKLNLSQFELAKIFNDFSGLFSNISNKNLALPASEQVRSLFKNNLTVVTSNVPKLFLVEAYYCLIELFGNLAIAKNIFVTQKCLERKEIRKYLQAMLEKNKELNVFVDFSSGNFDVLRYFDIPSDRCFVIVVSNEAQSNEVIKIVKNEGLEPDLIKIDYGWKSLNIDIQNELLKHKVNFQKKPNLTLFDLSGKDLPVDSKTLNMILNEQEIPVNLDIGLERSKNFELLYLERDFVKYEKEDKAHVEDKKLMHGEITDEESTDEESTDWESTDEESTDWESTYEESTDEKSTDEESTDWESTDEDSTDWESKDEETNFKSRYIEYMYNLKWCEHEEKTDNKTSVQFNELCDAKIMLISDVAGSGKSWAMRNLAIELARSEKTRWVTFVDLKQFIPHFKKCIDSQKVPNFRNFIIGEVLEKKTNFELEIFELKYEKGEAAIFLDGFDEIAPNCAEYVRELIKTFNFSNQIFISTRDYFEVELKNVLKVNFALKLDKFSEEDGEDLIARIWRLNDFKSLEDVELERDIVDSEEFKNYFEPAIRVFATIDSFNWRGIGMPQIYSMIATITKEKKSLDANLSIYQLYLKMYEMVYDEWSTKNELRKEVNIKKQVSKVNFLKLHELKAMQRFAPGKSEYCDINPQYEWEKVLVDGCGILAKRDEDFVFIHETFYEFFVAEFILRNLRYLETAAEAFEYLQKAIAGGYKNVIIRKFLDEGLQNEKIGEKNLHDENIFDEKKDERLQLLAKNLNKNLLNEKNFFDFFTTKLQDFKGLGDFLMEILKKANFRLEGILTKKMKKLIPCNEDEDRRNKKLIFLQETLIKLTASSFDIQTIVNATIKLDTKSLSFVKESLKFQDKLGQNIFWKLAQEKVLSVEMFEKFLGLLKNFLTPLEIADKMKECDNDGENVINSWNLRKNILHFKIFLRGFRKFYEDEFSLDDFKEILMQKDEFGKNGLIEFLAKKDFTSVDELETKWNLLLETFENDTKGLSEFINHHRFIHTLISSEDSNKLKFFLNQLKIVLKKSDWDGILNLKSNDDKNLLLYSTQKSKTAEIIEILLDFLQDLMESKEELSKVFTESDFYGNNFFHHVLRCSTEDSLRFCTKKLTEIEILTREEIKSKLSCLNKFGQNLLQHAGLFTIEFDTLKVFQEYFDSKEIVKLVKHRDLFGKSYLDICLMNKDKKLVEVKINEIIEEMTKSSLASEEQVEKLNIALKNKISGSPNDEDLKVLSLDWIQEGTSNGLVHPIEPQELKKLLLHQNENGENFIHQNLSYSKYPVDYIQSILEKVEAEMDDETLKQLLSSTNHKGGKNLMQVSVQKHISNSFYEYLWKLMREKIDNETILDILKHKNKWNCNFLLTLAEYGTKQITEITWREIEEIFRNSGEEFKSQIMEMLKERSSWNNANILHLAAFTKNCSFSFHVTKVGKYLNDVKEFVTEVNDVEYFPTILFLHAKCEDKKCHEALLNVLFSCFEDRNEFFKFLMQPKDGDYKKNFIYNLIKENEVVGFVLETLKNILSDDQFTEILTSNDENEQNLLQFAFKESKKVQTVEAFWKHYEKLKDLLDIILEVNKWGRNVIRCAAQNSTAQVLDFLCKKLKNFNQNEKVKEAILSDRDLMIEAAFYNESKESHESLWKLLHTFLDKTDILALVKETDYSGRNVLHKAVEKNTPEVVEFIWSQIKKLITNEEEIKKYLRRKGQNGKSLREFAIENKSHSSEMAELVKKLKNIRE